MTEIFGKLVPSNLRKLDYRQRLIAQQQINNTLFNLEMNSIYPQVHQLYSSTPTSSPSLSVYEMPQFPSQPSPAYLSSTNSPSLQDGIQFSRQSPLPHTQSSEYQLEYQIPQQAGLGTFQLQ
ncbi:unnamed protein product [Macrosiphum euphorbiae]|uniref:Uncharacterized protein n=1 Tax=Macrosiphum euphorbiae TaxID=13131 RepID=A0AAV0WQX8_9HEMI|nr:unnamed protein product [Macrosiphum euphorbiae]